MRELTDKEIIAILKSLVYSGDLKLKVNVTEDEHEITASGILNYKNRKIANVKYVKNKSMV